MQAQYRQAINQYRQRIYSFAHYSLRAREDAEDVTQDVFIKLWQHWRQIDHDRLSAWLMRVAHNTVIDHVRKSRTVRQHVDDYAEVELQEANVSAAHELDRSALQRELQVAIKALDDPFRSIVILRDIQGLSYAEIEHILDMSASQVKVYLHRSRRKLRENPRLRQLFAACTDLPPDSTDRQDPVGTAGQGLGQEREA